MKYECVCGELLWNGKIPNDIELHVYTDKEMDDIISMGQIDTLDIPDPKYEVWRCTSCRRIYVFEENGTRIIQRYRLEYELKD
ncbi:hypothetical protein IC619_016390 [Hazenella sp. IB182353]|uniref:hypothetical protein n=1 Tax=Polycladospora coralii TaxID=2771432 RepID=UPI001747413E|nr:hypothetical protein [Polycladospora coralii]MBS7532026.1 hypothetical protein [Polycladospora coralii]